MRRNDDGKLNENGKFGMIMNQKSIVNFPTDAFYDGMFEPMDNEDDPNLLVERSKASQKTNTNFNYKAAHFQQNRFKRFFRPENYANSMKSSHAKNLLRAKNSRREAQSSIECAR